MPAKAPRTRILLLGADGQVGHELARSLVPFGELMAANRSGTGGRLALDLERPGALAEAIAEFRPQWIVNAAAYTAVDKAEDEPQRADRINHLVLGELAEAAQRIGAAVVHYSTDYVFAGDASDAYVEDQPCAPLGEYGKSKLAGEVALRSVLPQHLILRTAWVYAARGVNFLRTMLRLAAERSQLRVVADQIGAPTPAFQIANATAAMLYAQGSATAAERERRWGTYHLSAAGRVSWHGFAQAIVDQSVERGWLRQAPEVVPINTADYPTRARRPGFSCLDGNKLATEFGIALPDWQLGLHQVLDELTDPQRIVRPTGVGE